MSTTDSAKAAITKRIIVLMPFEGEIPRDAKKDARKVRGGEIPRDAKKDARKVRGGPDDLVRFYKRFYNLMFRRFRYVVERKVGSVKHRGHDFSFSVHVFLTRIGPIPRDALQAIRDSDVVIAYINAYNSTVIYELAARTMLRAEWIVIVDHTIDARLPLLAPREWSRLIPFYLRQFGYTELGKEDNDPVFEEVVELALDPDRINLVGFDDDTLLEQVFDPEDFESPVIPVSLRKKINGPPGDSFLVAALKGSLEELIQQPRGKPDYIRGIMEEFDPEFMISNGSTSTYYPSVVMKYTFYPRDEFDGRDYLESDLDGEGVACDWNSKFLELFGWSSWDRSKALTDTVLSERIRRFTFQKDFDDFVEDQILLTRNIIFGNDIGLAHVPIRMKRPPVDYDLCLVSQAEGVPQEGKKQIVVADVNGVLRVLVFDEDGRLVVDADQTAMEAYAVEFEQLQRRLARLWPPHQLTQPERNSITSSIVSIIDHHPDPKFWGKRFLPAVILKKPMGRKTSMHFLYTFLIFYEISGDEDQTAFRYNM